MPENLPALEFFGRREELDHLARFARDLTRGWGRSIYLWGPPGVGKTALLRHFLRRLREKESPVLTVYYAFPRLSWPLTDFAAHFTAEFSRQYLAFRRGRPGQEQYASDEDLLEKLPEEGGEAGAFLAERYRRLSDPSSQRSPAREAALLARRFSEASGIRVLLVLDDFHHFEHYQPPARRWWPKEAFASHGTATLLAGRQVEGPGRSAGMEELAGVVESWQVARLQSDAAGKMLRSLLRSAGADVPDALQGDLVGMSGGMPFALKALVLSIGRGERPDEAGLQRAYATSVCRGEIYRYWMQILSAAFPGIELRRRALEVLVYCLQEGQSPPEVETLASHMLKSGREVDDALEALQRTGLASVECARVRVLPDPTLRDFLLSLYGREKGGRSGSFVEAALAAEKVRSAPAERSSGARAEARARLGTLLLGWAGQKVPKALFSPSEFQRRYGSVEESGLLEALGEDGGTITLPRVLSVASGAIGQEVGLPPFDSDAVAWADREAGGGKRKDVCWVVMIFDGPALTGDDIKEFDDGVNALQTAGALPAGHGVKWVISSGKIEPGALERARESRILVSTAFQADLLGRFLGAEIGNLLETREVEVEESTLDFEMSIPMVSETELVAARAVEQLALSMNFDTNEIGKIKMALVEACINAFEHSGHDDDKVRLFFSSDGGSLTVRVENRGRQYAPQKIQEAGSRKGMTRRGWGLSLIRELMDEVDFEPRDDGVSLVMVKHLSGKEEGRE